MEVVPHPQFLDALFVFRSKLSTIFRDVLGIHQINHIAVSQVSTDSRLLTFSSTPSLEFNLFNSNLWRYDKSYQPEWFTQCVQADWQSLYSVKRYDELYYLKQVKCHYPIGYTSAAKLDDYFFIYSFASHSANDKTRELFIHCYDDFYKIGQYCSTRMKDLFQNYDSLTG